MKRSRRLVILLGLLLAACAATFGVIRYEEHKEVIRNSDAIVLEIDSDAVQTLSWEYGAETLAFHKEDTWLYDGDAAFPVDEEKIQERLELFRAFGVSFIIEDVEDYGQYGLDKPICTSACQRRMRPGKSCWAITAAWIRSGMSPLGTETSIWCRMIRWTILTPASAI